MINEDVIKVCESTKFHIICISEEMNLFIKENYTEGDSEGKFYSIVD